MKKRYKKPQMDVVKMGLRQLLCGSNSGEFGSRPFYMDEEQE